MIRFTALIVAVPMLLLTAPVHAAPSASGCAAEKSVVDTAVQPYVYAGGEATAAKAVGMIVGVWLAGRPCYYGYGTTRIGEQDVPTARTLWEMGSNTKTFTATMLALHQLDGSVRAKAAVDVSRLPCVEDDNGQVCLVLSQGMEALTYFELATFTGGLFDDPPNYDFQHASDYTEADFFEAFDAWAAPPGGLPAPDVYSNSSYGLLGQLLMSFDGYTDFADADVFRRDFERWIGGRILLPLGMACTNPNPAAMPGACGASTRLATGYHVVNGSYEPEDMPWPWVPWGPAGSLRSNVRDMVRYIGAYLGNHEVEGLPVPRRLTYAMRLARRATPVIVGQSAPASATSVQQAYAWDVLPAHPGYALRFWKDGETDNFSSCVTGVPTKNVGVVIIVNTAMHPGDIPCDINADIAIHTP